MAGGGTYTIVTDELKFNMITHLLEEYYSLLPEDMKCCQFETSPPNASSQMISLFKRPSRRIFLSKFSNRVEYLNAYYLELSLRGKVYPIPKFCKQMDAVIDSDGVLTAIDLNDQNINDDNIAFLLDPIEISLSYLPDLNFPWKENMTIDTIDLGGNAIVEEVPRVIRVITTFFPSLKVLNLSDVNIGPLAEVSY